MWVNPNPAFGLHDSAQIREKVRVNPSYAALLHSQEIGLENPGKDFVLIQMGARSHLVPTSIRAIQETTHSIPHQIDRDYFIGEMTFSRYWFANSGFGMVSSEVQKHSRSTVVQTMQLNKASQYVPMISEVTKNLALKYWKEGETIEFLDNAKFLLFQVLVRVLFGRDVDVDMTFPYLKPDDSKEHLTFPQLLMRYVDEGLEGGFTFVNMAFPQAVKYRIGTENQRMYKNFCTLKAALQGFADNSKDS